MALPRRTRWIWWTLLALSPLAYAAGVKLLTRESPVHYSIGRQEAVDISRRLAAEKGFSTQGWRIFVTGVGNNRLQAYYRRHDSPIEGQLQQIVPAYSVRTLQVFFGEQGEKSYFQADLGPQGQVLGYEFDVAETHSQADLGEEASRQLAEQAFRRRAEPIAGLEAAESGLESDQQDDSVVRTFSWKGTPAQASEMTLTFAVAVRNGIVTAERAEAEVDADFLPPQLGDQAVGLVIMGALVALTWFLLGIFGLVRFIRRLRQKELSLPRVWTISLILGLALTVIVLLNAPDLIGIAQAKGGPWWLLWVGLFFGVLTNLLMAVFLGLAWGSGEGDVREAYPGKLTSVDALMTGKIFSRNVSAAMLAGSLLGGWLVLAKGIFQLLGGSAGATENLAIASFVPLPGLYILFAPLERTVPVAIFGLLLPLAFSSRSFKKARWRRFFLGAASLFACTGMALSSDFPLFGLMFAAVLAASLLGLFRAFDFLTAAAALNAFLIASNVALFPVDLSVAWKGLALAALVAAPLLAAQAYFALRGRHWREAEVSPVYARHIEERRALKAEVSAARQAQLRLAPQSVPSLPGLSVAATCQPAQEVGGDFYDFFPVGQSKLGILLAEGGGEGLPAALSVAYAKGLLMPMAAHASAAQVMDYLERSLKDLLNHTTRMGFLYALVDVSAGTLSYARLGEYPRILAVRNGASGTEQPAFADKAARAFVKIQPGDRYFLFTDGIAHTLAVAEESPDEWLRSFLGSRRESTAEEILQAFLEALGSRVKRAQREGLDDDLSSIILNVSPAAAFGAQSSVPQEQVA